MAFLSGKNNNFRFAFSKPFIPQEIEDKYSPVLNRIPGNMCENVLDFVNKVWLPYANRKIRKILCVLLGTLV